MDTLNKDTSLLVLNDKKAQYFEKYLANRNGRLVKNGRLMVTAFKKHEVRVKANDDLLATRYISRPNNRIEVYAYDSTEKMFVRNNGKNPIYIRHNGMELVVLPGKCQALLKERPAASLNNEVLVDEES